MKQYYTTFFIKYKPTRKITNPEKFLSSLGEEGTQSNHLLDLSDRRTVLVDKPPFNQAQLADYTIQQKLIHLKVLMRLIQGEFTYTKYTIPKASGGYRTIHAPNEPLKRLQRNVKHMLEQLDLLTHNAAHGCVPNRSDYTNALYHKHSNHFARVDFKDFFPSITYDLLIEHLPKIGIFSHADTTPALKELISLIVGIGTHQYKLPQGSPISPMLANLFMIPFDYHMEKNLKEFDKPIIYTRYVDDMQFSSFYAFADRKEDAKEMLHKLINRTLIDAYGTIPLFIKESKTLVSTKYGKNRITGVKVNPNNILSIGYKEKRELKQNIARLIIQKKKGEKVSYDEVQAHLGTLSYLNKIEPEYKRYLVRTLARKFKLGTYNLQYFLTTN